MIDRPILAARVEHQGRPQIRKSRSRSPSGNRAKRIGVQVARLPLELRKALRKEGRMLARAAGDLQHDAFARQPIAQHLGDRLAVAQGSGR